MKELEERLRGLSEADREVHDRAVEAFERRWAEGRDPPPDLASFLPDDEPLRTLMCEALVLVDLHQQFRRGTVRIEEYLSRFPELGHDPDVVLELLDEEFDQRRHRARKDMLDDYEKRFPDIAPKLRTWHSPCEGRLPTLSELHYEVGDLFTYQGGLGELWRAKDATGREFLLKSVNARLSDNLDLQARLLREALITAKLAHPGVVPVYAVAEQADGQPCFAMKLLEGKHFGDIIQYAYDGLRESRRPLPRLKLRELLRILISVTETMVFAHEQQVVHRDLKPENIFVGRDGVFVLDWGLARDFSADESEDVGRRGMTTISETSEKQQITYHGLFIGSPTYMSPEQARGDWKEVNTLSDVYSLGAVLYYVITGSLPFYLKGTDEDSVALHREEIQSGFFPSPHTVAPHVDRRLEAICLKAMANDPSQRYSGVSDLANDLRNWLDGERVSAFDTIFLKAGRLIVHNAKKTVALASLFAASFVGLIVGNLFINQEKQRTEQVAEQALNALRLTSEVAGDWLDSVSSHQDHSQDFLVRVLGHFEELSRIRAADPAVRREVGIAHRRVGDINSRLARYDVAMLAYQQAIAYQRALHFDVPDDVDIEQDLATSLTNLALQYDRLHRFHDAVPLYREAIRISEDLTRRRSDQPAFRSSLAQSWNNLAESQRQAGEVAEAEVAVREALAILEALTREWPNRPEYRRDLASAHVHLGLALELQNKQDEAETHFAAAIVIQRSLVSQPGASPDHRKELSNTLSHLSRLIADRGELDKAEALLQEVIPIQHVLADAFPGDPSYRMELLASYNALGGLLASLSRLTQAEQAYRRTLEIQRGLLESYPDVQEHLLNYAGITSNLCNLLVETGRGQEAEDQYREVLERLETHQPTGTQLLAPNFMFVEALCRHNRGNLLQGLDRRDDAIQSFERAVALYESLVTRLPDQVMYRRNLAGSLSSLGLLQSEGQSISEALETLRRAQEILEELSANSLNVLGYRQELATTLHNIGEVLRNTGRYDEAEPSYARARTLREDLTKVVQNQLEYRRNLGDTEHALGLLHLKRGRLVEAEESFNRLLAIREALIKSAPKVVEDAVKFAGTLTDLARVKAVTSAVKASEGDRAKADANAAQAVELLWQALDAGAFRTARDADRLLRDPDFEILTSRDDFQAFVRDLIVSEAPFAP